MLGSQRRRARRRLTDDESNELAEMLDAHLDREPVGREREEAVEQAWRDAKDQDELTFNWLSPLGLYYVRYSLRQSFDDPHVADEHLEGLDEWMLPALTQRAASMHELEGIAARLDDGAAVIAAPQAGPLCPVVWRWLLDARTRGLVEAANQSPTETTAWRLSEAGTKRASELLSSSWERLKERITTADSMARRIMDSPLLRLLWGAVPVGAILIYLETPPVRTVVLSLYVLLGVVAAWLYIDHLRYIRRRKGRGRLAPATQKAPRRSHAVRLAVVKECATQLVVKQDAELSALRPRFTAAGGRQ